MTAMTVERSKSSAAEWLTVERALFGAILLVGAGVRLVGLADQPLSPLEAANAWPAWLRAMGLDASLEVAPASALLFSLQTFVFWLTNGGDSAARFASAVAGAALVWLPWLWRGWLGRTVALAVALLIAIDPWLVALSRFAASASLTLLLFATVLTSLFRLRELRVPSHARRRYWLLMAFAGGLMLVSGPLAWSLAPVLLAFIFVYGRPSLASVDGEEGRQHGAGYLLILFFGSALLGSTAWLSFPGGIGHVGSSLSVWLRQFFVADAYSLSWAVTRLAVDQLLLLVLGSIGLFLLWRNVGPVIQGGRRPWATFLTVWATWGIVLLLLPGRDPMSLLVLHIALLLAAGHALGTLVEGLPPGLDWREATAALAVLAILLISFSFWGRSLMVDVNLSINLAAILLLLAVSLGMVLAVYAVWGGWRSALWLGSAVMAVLLLVSSLSSLWQLNHVHRVATPDGLFAETAHPDVRQLAEDVATISAQRIGDAGEMPVQVQMAATADPLLGWYLRDMRRLDWVLTPDLTAVAGQRPLAITLDPELAAADDYVGGAYDVRVNWLPSMLWQQPLAVAEPSDQESFSKRLQYRLDPYWQQRLRPIMRWVAYREVASAPTAEEVILWAPVETAGGQ